MLIPTLFQSWHEIGGQPLHTNARAKTHRPRKEHAFEEYFRNLVSFCQNNDAIFFYEINPLGIEPPWIRRRLTFEDNRVGIVFCQKPRKERANRGIELPSLRPQETFVVERVNGDEISFQLLEFFKAIPVYLVVIDFSGIEVFANVFSVSELRFKQSSSTTDHGSAFDLKMDPRPVLPARNIRSLHQRSSRRKVFDGPKLSLHPRIFQKPLTDIEATDRVVSQYSDKNSQEKSSILYELLPEYSC
jgi:hypothetical protein